MSKGTNYGLDNASDFELPEELLGVLPADPYEQLELARRITSIAVGSRVSKLEADAAKLKTKITEKDQTIYGLEEKINQLEKALNETDERLSHSLEEQAKLTHEKSVLAANVKKLNRDVAKLETFKKTLMQSLQEEDEAAQAEVTKNTAIQRIMSAKSSFSLSSRGDSNVPIGGENQVSTAVSERSNSTVDDDNQASRHGTLKGIALTPHNNTPPQLTPTGSPKRMSAAGSPKRLSPHQSPRRHSASVSPTRHQFEGRLSYCSSLPASHQHMLHELMERSSFVKPGTAYLLNSFLHFLLILRSLIHIDKQERKHCTKPMKFLARITKICMLSLTICSIVIILNKEGTQTMSTLECG